MITDVNNCAIDSIIIRARILNDFDGISDERYDELVSIAQWWSSLVPVQYRSKTAIYSVINQAKLLGLKNAVEQLTLFILLIDNDLDMLRIYDEESKTDIIERRITEQFGYYHKELLRLEKKYHKRFCPDKPISLWTERTKSLNK